MDNIDEDLIAVSCPRCHSRVYKEELFKHKTVCIYCSTTVNKDFEVEEVIEEMHSHLDTLKSAREDTQGSL